MSAGNENSDITNAQESLISSDESKGVSGAKEAKVESQTVSGINPNKVADNPPPQGGTSPGSKSNKPANETDSAELFTNWSEFVQFVKDTYIEFRKISWPTRQQVLQETWSVIVLVSLLTGLVLCFDWGVAKVVFEPMDKFAKKLGGGVGNTMQTWGPLTPVPGAPTDQPGVPGNQPETPLSSPDGKLNTTTTPIPAPSGQPAKSDGAASSKPEDAKPGDSK